MIKRFTDIICAPSSRPCANFTSTNPTKVTSTLAKSNVRQRWNVRIALNSKLILFIVGKYAKIERENRILLEKMSNIM